MAPFGALGVGTTTKFPVPFAGNLVCWDLYGWSNNIVNVGVQISVQGSDWNVADYLVQMPADKNPNSGTSDLRGFGDIDPVIPVQRGDLIFLATNNDANISRMIVSLLLVSNS